MSNKLKVMISQPMRGKTNEQIKQERAELKELLKLNNVKITIDNNQKQFICKF